VKEYIDFSNGPLPDVRKKEASPFWEGTCQGEIRFPKCRDCGRYHWYPCLLCPFCHSQNIQWTPLTSQARLYSWSHVDWSLPSLGIRGPFILALVEFDEAPDLYLTSNLVECEPEDVHIGMALEVVYQKINETLVIPLFKPVNHE
jgi:uncharacterized OB-fold protein